MRHLSMIVLQYLPILKIVYILNIGVISSSFFVYIVTAAILNVYLT